MARKNVSKILFSGLSKFVMIFVWFSVSVNPAQIDEQTRPASVPAPAAEPAPAGTDKKDEDEKVGLALPGLIGLGALGHRIGIHKGMNS